MKISSIGLIESLCLFAFFYLVNIRSLIIWSLFPPVESVFDAGWLEIFFWLPALFGIAYVLTKLVLWKTYLLAWMDSPILVVFILYSLVSVFWASQWQVVLHRSLVLLFATSCAVYLGVRFSVDRLLKLFITVGMVIVISSFLLALLSPALGTDLNPPFLGAWRGIFWHKNHLGNILPMFVLYSLIRLMAPLDAGWREKVSAWILYIFSIIVTAFSESASGLILIVVIHATVGIGIVWRKVMPWLKSWHYLLIILLATCILASSTLFVDDLLKFLGKDMSLTGRLPMWEVLFREVVVLRPWFGAGFGSIWADLEFRKYLRDAAGWAFHVMIGDNGFIDILLNLGVVGLCIFLFYYFENWVEAVRHFFRGAGIEHFLPLLFLVFSLFANLTYSLFFETEVFVWSTLVVFDKMVFLKATYLAEKDSAKN